MRRHFLILLLALFACSAVRAADFVITATVAVTNVNGTSNGMVIAVGSDIRTWTNSVHVPATQILTNNTQNGAAGYLFGHLAVYPFSGLTLGSTASTNVTLKGATNAVFTVFATNNWATVSYVTNLVGYGYPAIVPLELFSLPHQTNLASGIVHYIDSGKDTNGYLREGSFVATGTGATNQFGKTSLTNLPPSHFVYQGADSLLTNYDDGGVLTNLTMVSSFAPEIRDWFTNNLDDGATLTHPTFDVITNVGFAWGFADVATNRMRLKLKAPWDWDGGTIMLGLTALCTGTNSAAGGTTNVVFSAQAAAIGNGDDVSSPTFGPAIWTTNNVGTAAYKPHEAIMNSLTVGNSPSPSKSILLEIQRLGSQAGDTLTNSTLELTEVRVFLKRKSRQDFPTPAP